MALRPSLHRVRRENKPPEVTTSSARSRSPRSAQCRRSKAAIDNAFLTSGSVPESPRYRLFVFVPELQLRKGSCMSQGHGAEHPWRATARTHHRNG
jgi:hypothetical protein